jgi:hypothetical protein
MLHSISWARFGAFIIIILVIYYGYVLLRFYARELRALVGVGKGDSDGMTRETVEVKKVKGVESGQAPLFPEAQVEAGVGETPELFKVMEKVVMLLRQVVSEAASMGVRREELEDRIRMVLSGYRQLVKTPYQVSINNFIQRSCSTTFSLLLSDKEVAGLWEG